MFITYTDYPHSTESEKSEEKCQNSQNSESKVKPNNPCAIAQTFPCNVEDMTKNQLDQIKEIVKSKFEKESSITSRKNSEKL
jgi:hypothetical protein